MNLYVSGTLIKSKGKMTGQSFSVSLDSWQKGSCSVYMKGSSLTVLKGTVLSSWPRNPNSSSWGILDASTVLILENVAF